MTELYRIHKYLNIPYTEILQMPVMYRRDLINIHNKIVEEEKEALNQKRK